MAEGQKQYWLHRITGGENGWLLSYPLLEKYGFMSTGWSFISSQELIADINERGIEAINEAYIAEGNQELSPNRFSLLRFIKGMHSGDVVVIPAGAYFGIYKIDNDDIFTNSTLPQEILTDLEIEEKGGLLYSQDGKEIDLGFYRHVTPICANIPRNQFASPDLRSHMRTRLTNSNITTPTIKDAIRSSIAAFKKNIPFQNAIKVKNEEYSRWLTTREHSWPYRIFKKSNDELMTMRMAQVSAKQYTYQHIKAEGGQWTSLAHNFLYTNNNQELTIKEWSDSFNKFENWSRLNQLLALCGSFESYLSAVIKLVIKSDPGLLLEAPQSLDGLRYIKYNIDMDNINIKEIVEGCTKGDWNARATNLRKLLMKLPQSLETNIDALEKIRKMRNNLGHAFGRDIDTFQTYDLYKLPKMDTLSSGQFRRLQSIVNEIARDLDVQIMTTHIGNFQPLYYYHTKLLELEIYSTNKEKAIELKKKLFTEANDSNYSTTFCEWVISYYEDL